MDWTTVFTCVMTSATTFAIAVLGFLQTKRSKETERYRKLKDQIEAERQKKIDEEKLKEKERLQALETSVNDMKIEVQALKEDMMELTSKNLTNIQQQLSHLHILQTGNMTYIESLSKVVLAIGETIYDSPSITASDKVKLSEMIKDHRKVESETRNSLYNIIA